ncbi:putative quinone oxidoreductase [Cavenderia fasciculata]|uniref:Probable quinone oxidoreductase n=1 Tax=Cavenderia fasciculata TaxID=261658 RepID=F4Q5P2_CACFS|nr:putative quinone oxidoreductase [Cavenderia fasciculata]EGG17301.1 putative quinone oxidoreductase [Cavenderia fasciculata]|eukprot:XP_004355785.1 putative quinone oxidoreductase [Cavenderia fasciculata]
MINRFIRSTIISQQPKSIYTSFTSSSSSSSSSSSFSFNNKSILNYISRKMSTTTTTFTLPNQMKAVRIHRTGGADVLQYEDVNLPTIKDNEVLVKNESIGINFIDTYHRTGLYTLPLPSTLGREGAGTVVQVGASIKTLQIGDRVTYFSPGSYAQYTAVPIAVCHHIDASLDAQTAAAFTLQGLTGHYLVRSTFALAANHTCLIHAGAGGLGQVLIQMAKIIGARVITTVSSKEKEELVLALGADHVINYSSTPDFSEQVKKLANDGKGVDVVYDGVGQATWQQSLKSLRPLGYLCLVGNASGPVPPIDPLMLSANGSLFVTRPTLADYLREPGSMQSRCTEIFKWVSQGRLKLTSKTVLPLSQAGEAHILLESRKSKGKLLLEPPTN